MLRQGLRVSIKELEDLTTRLMNEDIEFSKEFKVLTNPNKKWQISIINKQPKCSDTWEIEKC